MMENVGIEVKHPILPFTAFVDQEKLKLALILLAINPRISGVLVMGAKGTGKSALVRALAGLLPPIKVVKGCPFNDNPKDESNLCDICKTRLKNSEKLEYELKQMELTYFPR